MKETEMIAQHQYFILSKEDGEPIAVRDALEWARWFESAWPQRRIAHTELPGGVEVSTVFLGANHQFGGGPPLVFETMIFGGEWDNYQWRYTLRSEAQRGHDAVVAALRAGTAPTGE